MNHATTGGVGNILSLSKQVESMRSRYSRVPTQMEVGQGALDLMRTRLEASVDGGDRFGGVEVVLRESLPAMAVVERRGSEVLRCYMLSTESAELDPPRPDSVR